MTRSSTTPSVGASDKGLSDIAIVRVAREIIAEVGVDGLTMRELSTRLGVSLGATYHHVPTKHAVIQRVAQELFAEGVLPSPDAGSWRDQVKALVLKTALAIGQYPGMAAYVMTHVDDLGWSPLNEQMAGILTRAGFGAEELSNVMGALYFYGAGVSMNVLTARAAATFSDADVETLFQDGIDMLLDGAQLRLARRHHEQV